ncbi:putative secreted protein (Por secretion system target) [Winogradskyella epiphytica]|uniref:Putative secreted protein (Por secretion system target) n=1 Tax=Winogradskyella epiphytica TaxID=262005 RepID=A0A2V4XZV8_9FLAO|nr:Ig-like domain-containing protein [Winogradskyella epiphytica]PYE81698.1 putative secreted protein (Por secretion system target) [Winogradskyella epiphytica]
MTYLIKPIQWRVTLFMLFIFLFLNQIVSAQQLAFPSAYGAAAHITGGRGGTVIHVTNLNDSGPGSLREALTAYSENRYIVFDVSGVIQLQSKIQIIGPASGGSGAGNFTVNGFSAPYGGITIIGYPIVHRDVENYIYRGIRFRNGYKNQVNGERSNQTQLSNGYSINFIVDRCSFAYSKGMNTGGGSPTSNGEVGVSTFQNNLFGDSDRGILCGRQGVQEISDISVLRNVFSDVRYRTPNSGGEVTMDIINNFIYNWSTRTTRVNGWDSEINMIGNYYQGGKATRLSDRTDKAFIGITTNSSMNPKIWDEDNYIDEDAKPTGYPANPEKAWYQFPNSTVSPDPVKPEWFVNNRLPIIGREVPILSSSQLKTELFPKVGASEYIDNNGNVQYFRDNLDAQLIEKAINDIEQDYVPQSSYEALAENLVNTMPSESRPDNFYVSNPHIPEIWFQANVPEGQDHNDIAPSGYTWLEEYLNQVDYANTSNEVVSVESIEVTPDSAELQPTETIQLTATFTPANATNQNGVWSTSDNTIATVDSNGLVTAIGPGEVTITFTSADGGFTDTSQITVFPEALQASAGTDQQICQGESATLTASGGTGYVWSTGETTETIEVTPDTTTTYIVTVSDVFGQSEDAEVTITVNSLPVAAAGADQSICLGESIILTASGGDSYLWNTGETTASIEVSPNVETTYSVEVSSNNCSSADQVTVYVNESPNITISEDQVIVDGESTTLSVSGGDNYEWSTGETSETITVSPNVTTIYSVSSTNVNGCVTNESVTVTVVPGVTANAGEDATICSGESYTLTATGGTTYVWDTEDSGFELVVSPTITTTYTVTVEDEYGNSDSDSVTVFVNESPNITVSEDVYVIQGNSVSLSANGGVSYSWSSGETTAEISVSPAETTTYVVTGFSENGCQSTAEVTVIVVDELVANAGQDVSVCVGESAILTASGGTGYVWNTGETTASIEVTPEVTTTYTVTVTDDYGNSDSDEVTVTVDSPPTAYAGEDQIVCEGESVILIAEGGDSYLWSTGATTASISVSPSEDTIYSVEVFSNSCSDTDDVTVYVTQSSNLTISEDLAIVTGNSTLLEVSGAESYLWSTGETSNSIEVSPSETTTYSVIGYTTNGCESSAEVTVTVIPQLLANAGEDVSICNGETVTLNASGGVNYSWNTGDTGASLTVTPTETTTYMVTATDDYGNSDSDSVTVTVNESPSLTLSDNVTITEGESTNLIANGAATYLWSTGETSNTIEVSPTETTTYSVTGSSEFGCESSAEVTVTVVPQLLANAGEDVSICNGHTVTLNASGGVNYSWNTGDTGSSLIVTPTETTTYTVTVTDDYGNSDSDSVTVTVNESPSLTLSDNVTITEGESTNLIANGAATYLWSTGETSNTIEVSPTETTTYSVTGTSAFGCESTVEVTVSVSSLFQASAGPDQHVCDNLENEVVLTASEGDSYLWSTGKTTQSIVVSPLSTTTYTVTVSQGDQSDSADVIVYVDPSPSITIANGEEIEILNGDFVTLSVSGANTYEWNNGATQPNIAVSPSVTTIYSVKGFIGNCYDEKQVKVKVLQPVVADAGSDVQICLNETTALTATGGDEYVWSTGETTATIHVSPTETTEYTVTVFNSLDFDEDSVVVEVDSNCTDQVINPNDPYNPNDERVEFTMDIYPNPASNIVNIKLSGTQNESQVLIYDVTGKLIIENRISNESLNISTTTQMDISSLQAGVYFVKIIDQGRDITKKLIVE